MFPTIPQSEVFGVAAHVLFVIWPVVLAIPMYGRSEPWGGILVWIFLLGVRIYMAINPLAPTTPIATFQIIPEPLNTYLFFAGGAFLVLVIYLRRLRTKRQ